MKFPELIDYPFPRLSDQTQEAFSYNMNCVAAAFIDPQKFDISKRANHLKTIVLLITQNIENQNLLYYGARLYLHYNLLLNVFSVDDFKYLTSQALKEQIKAKSNYMKSKFIDPAVIQSIDKAVQTNKQQFNEFKRLSCLGNWRKRLFTDMGAILREEHPIETAVNFLEIVQMVFTFTKENMVFNDKTLTYNTFLSHDTIRDYVHRNKSTLQEAKQSILELLQDESTLFYTP